MAVAIFVTIGMIAAIVGREHPIPGVPPILSAGLCGTVGGALGGAIAIPLMLSAYRPHIRAWRRSRRR